MDKYIYKSNENVELKHSENDAYEPFIDEFLEMSDDEFENYIKHTFDDDDLDFIAHYGIKGMKWGVINEDEPIGGGIKAKISNLKDRLANVVQKLTGKTVRTDNDSEKVDPNGKTLTEDKLVEDKKTEDKIVEDKKTEDKLNQQKEEQINTAIKKIAKEYDDPVLLNLSKEAQKEYLDKVDPNWDKPNNAATVAAGPKNQNKISERNIEDNVAKKEGPSLVSQIKKSNMVERKGIETDLNRKEGTITAEQLNKVTKDMPKYKYTEQSNKDYNHDLGNKLLSNIKENNPDKSLYENAIKAAEKSDMNFRIDSRKLTDNEDFESLNKKSEKLFNEWIEDYVKKEKEKIHNAAVASGPKNKTSEVTDAKKAIDENKDSTLDKLKKKNPKERVINHSDELEDFLIHWGILGQRWGIRKYQDEYGRLTEAGKVRYGKNKDNPDAIASIKRGEDAAEEKAIFDTSYAFRQTGDLFKKTGKNKNPYKTEYKKTKYSKMSDAELNARINRIKKEEEYANLVGDNKYVKSGQEKARETLQTIGSIVAIGGTVATIAGTARSVKEGYTKNK